MKRESLTDRLFLGDFDGLLPHVPAWDKKSINRKLLRNDRLILVSAVCPDYEHVGGKFTYRGVGTGVPYIAQKHLQVAALLQERLHREGKKLQYHVTLADTEYDLPSVMKKMTGGDSKLFLERCEASCNAIVLEAEKYELSIASCRRFTAVFPLWNARYEEARTYVATQAMHDDRVSHNVMSTVISRWDLYASMSADSVDVEYCKEMVIRQLAQYATWGSLATEVFGENLVMMNHSTPNLVRVNDSFFRKEKERIPILKLALSTVPLAR